MATSSSGTLHTGGLRCPGLRGAAQPLVQRAAVASAGAICALPSGQEEEPEGRGCARSCRRAGQRGCAHPPPALHACRFCFPALKPPQPFQQLGSAAPLAQALGTQAAAAAAAACDAWRGVGGGASTPGGSAPFWLLLLPGRQGAYDAGAGDGGSAAVQARPLSEWRATQAAGSSSGGAAAAEGVPPPPRILLAMSDPSPLPLTPGWPLRNALLLASKILGAADLEVLCCRDAPSGRCDAGASFVVRVRLQPLAADAPPPQSLGWEADAQGRLAPRWAAGTCLQAAPGPAAPLNYPTPEPGGACWVGHPLPLLGDLAPHPGCPCHQPMQAGPSPPPPSIRIHPPAGTSAWPLSWTRGPWQSRRWT